MGIKNFYLKTPLPRYEYLRLKISDMSDNVIKAYRLQRRKDMYMLNATVECMASHMKA